MAWGEAIAAGASILGGFLSRGGQESANQQNAQMARDQMAFQERMSNTAYQRGMADMKAAGLNPILAYQRGGASTPGGALANMTNPDGAWSTALPGAVNSALAVNRNAADVEKIKTDTTKSVSENDLVKAGVDKAKMDTATSAAQAANYQANTDKAKQETVNAVISNELLKVGVGSAQSEARIKAAEAQAAENYGPGPLGQQGRTVEAVVQRVLKAAGIGTGSPDMGIQTPRVPNAKTDAPPPTTLKMPGFIDREMTRKIGEPRRSNP